MAQYLADIYHSVSSALQGMAVTIKHFVRKPVTLQYPDERWVLPERFRGFVHLNVKLCNACTQCARSCPVSCIYIETEGKGKDRYMTRWAVDFNKCIWCGFCTDPCPTQAVTMSHDYDHSVYDRRRFVYEYVPPDQPVPTHKEKRRAMGYYVEEDAEPKKAAPAKADPKPAAESQTSASKPVVDETEVKPPTPPPAESPSTPPVAEDDSKGESQ